MNQNKRFQLIDFFRGIAVITMIIFHFFYMLDFFGIKNNDMYSGYFLILARFTQIIFLTLVGVSLAISKHYTSKGFILKQYKRGIKIALFAAIISLTTYLYLGTEMFVKFGILHFISVSIFICAYFADKKLCSLLLGILSFLLADLIYKIGSSIKILYIFGFNIASVNSVDYFPVFPWISLVFIGIFLANIYLKYSNSILKLTNKFLLALPTRLILNIAKIAEPIIFLGRHALMVYMIHVPIILILILILKIFDLYLV